jgi:hypothetical protein
MAQSVGNAKNILVGASPLFLSTIDVNDSDYVLNAAIGKKPLPKRLHIFSKINSIINCIEF